MAIHTQSNVTATNVRYSAFLGMLYVSTNETEALIKEAKALVGESEVKKGYQGNKGDSPSAKAIAFLRDKNISPVKVSGTLSSARVIQRAIDGRSIPYLNVGLKDDDGWVFISVEIGQSAAQMLVRKLVNATPGSQTTIGLFAKYEQRDGASRAYANHGATLCQNGTEIKGIDTQETLVPRINTAIKVLQDAGISKEENKETFAIHRNKVELDFHLELMQSVTEKFAATVSHDDFPADIPEKDAA